MNQTTLQSENSISKDIFEFYDYLMDNFMLPELRNHIRKNENAILRETFQRGWIGFFKNKQKSHFSVVSKNRKNKEGVIVEKLVVCPSVFQLESVETHNEAIKKMVPSKPSRRDPDPAPQLREIIEKKPNALLSLNCTYSDSEKLLIIKPFSVDIMYDGKDENDYLFQLNRELAVVKSNFENNYKKEIFLSNFFDTLAANGYIVVDGKDVVYMAAIYPNIAKYFPDFSKLSKHKQLVILQQAAIKGRKSDKKDIHTFAYSTFYELLNANCINTFVKYDTSCNRFLSYEKIAEYYDYYFDEKKKIRVPNKDMLLFVCYKRPEYKTSFDSGTLWSVLTRKGMDHLT